MSEIEQTTRNLITEMRVFREAFPELSDAEIIEMILV